MLLFMRGITIQPASFPERALREEMLTCLREAEYYENLAKRYQNRECRRHGEKMLKRFYHLAESPAGSQILADTLFEKKGEFYKAVLRHG